MTKKEKLLEKFKNNPEGVNLRELLKILAMFDYSQQSQSGSHAVYVRDGDPFHITLPIHGNDCKKGYKILVFNRLFPKD